MKQYPNPPITEAVISIRFKQEGPFDCKALGEFKRSVQENFPVSAPVHLLELTLSSPTLENGAVGAMLPSPTEVGLRLATATNSRVIQIQQSDFTLSHLPPYESWAPFINEMKLLWEKFVERYVAVSVTRVSVRFINKIEIPKVSIEMEDYFNIYPTIPKGIHQDFTGMLLQVQMPQPDLGNSTAVVNLALATPDDPKNIAIALDIDLFTEMQSVDSRSPAIWETLDNSRNRKNELFEAFITDNTRRLFS